MAYAMTVMPGLPPYGEPALSFSKSGEMLYSEHLVVKFTLDDAPAWVGNFDGGIGGLSLALVHPNGYHALVISAGMAYIVDPHSRDLIDTFGGAIESIFEYPPLEALVINHQGLFFEAIGPSGSLWESPRVALDGVRNIRLEGNVLSGEAWWGDGRLIKVGCHSKST